PSPGSDTFTACVNPCQKPRHVCHPASARDDKGCFEENCVCSTISSDPSSRNCSNVCPAGEKCHSYSAVDAQGCPLPGCMCVPDCVSPCPRGKRCEPNSTLDTKGCFKQGCICEPDCAPRCPAGMDCEPHTPRDLHGCFLMGCSCECVGPCPPGERCVENSTKDARGCFAPGCSCENATEVHRLWRKAILTWTTTPVETSPPLEDTNGPTTHIDHGSYSTGPPDTHILIPDGQRIITDRNASSQGHASQKSEERFPINIFWPLENDSSEEAQHRYTFDVNTALSTKPQSPNGISELVFLENASASLPTERDDETADVFETDSSEDNVSTSPGALPTPVAYTEQGAVIGTTTSSTNVSLHVEDNAAISNDFLTLETSSESAMTVPRTDVPGTSSLGNATLSPPSIIRERNATS
ncbi:hypothetical protein MTO96_034150, partial [Rhipicephalus appendiculatus]